MSSNGDEWNSLISRVYHLITYYSDANCSRFWRETYAFVASSPALPLWYITLPLFTSTINIEYLVKNKTDLVWDLAHFQLKTWIFLIRSTVSGAFLLVFSHWQRLCLASKRWFRIFIVCTSCKTSYNVLSHSYWGSIFRGGKGGSLKFRGVWKKVSLQILGLQRLASLLLISWVTNYFSNLGFLTCLSWIVLIKNSTLSNI